jgi:hypothetical protein
MLQTKIVAGAQPEFSLVGGVQSLYNLRLILKIML